MLTDSPVFSISNQRFNVVVLAAGLGTRLGAETDFIPKPLVEIGGARGVDFAIQKYQYVADRIIIASGYSADLLENYVRGKYRSLNIACSREDVAHLRGPGWSLLYALDHASSKFPTIVTFCDYIVNDQISVDADAIVVCRPGGESAVLDTYKTVAVIEEGVVTDLVLNQDRDNVKENGFTGIAIFHDTVLLKAIVYGAAARDSGNAALDYALDVVREYVTRVRTVAVSVSNLLEFGTKDTLTKTREHIHGDH